MLLFSFISLDFVTTGGSADAGLGAAVFFAAFAAADFAAGLFAAAGRRTGFFGSSAM